LKVRKKQIDPQNILLLLSFLGHHPIDSNNFDDCAKQISFAKIVSALIAGVTECLRIFLIVLSGLWSLINAKATQQERFYLSYSEMCSLTMFTIYCYVGFILKIRKKTYREINSHYLGVLAGEHTANLLVSIYVLETKIFKYENATLNCSWYTEMLLAILCHQDLTNLKSIKLKGKIGEKEIFQLTQLKKFHPSLKILLNTDTKTICFDKIKGYASKIDDNLLTSILEDIDFNQNLKILIIMNDLDSHEMLYHQHLIVLLLIRNPNLSLTLECTDNNFLSEIERYNPGIEIRQTNALQKFDLVFYRGAPKTILTNSKFQRFVYFYEAGAPDYNTLHHLGRKSVSLNLRDLQSKPLSKKSFKISIN